jgi:CBS domain-containing protein
MVPNPISLRDDATVPEAVALLTDRGHSAAPVIDEAGRPVGVLTRTDLLVHEREQVRNAQPGEAAALLVRDVMTPIVFTVSTHTPSVEVIKRLCDLKVHQLFVVDDDNSLVGVISTFDIVRRLTSVN